MLSCFLRSLAHSPTLTRAHSLALTDMVLRAKHQVKHIRIENVNGRYSLGKLSSSSYDTVWELVEAKIGTSHKSRRGDKSVQLL